MSHGGPYRDLAVRAGGDVGVAYALAALRCLNVVAPVDFESET
jgi:hypothetical protein